MPHKYTNMTLKLGDYIIDFLNKLLIQNNSL